MLRRWFAGQQGVPAAGINEGYVVEPRAPGDTSLMDFRAAYIQESRRCDRVVADHSLDGTGAKAIGETSAGTDGDQAATSNSRTWPRCRWSRAG
jgi:hypothetical protein